MPETVKVTKKDDVATTHKETEEKVYYSFTLSQGLKEVTSRFQVNIVLAKNYAEIKHKVDAGESLSDLEIVQYIYHQSKVVGMKLGSIEEEIKKLEKKKGKAAELKAKKKEYDDAKETVAKKKIKYQGEEFIVRFDKPRAGKGIAAINPRIAIEDGQDPKTIELADFSPKEEESLRIFLQGVHGEACPGIKLRLAALQKTYRMGLLARLVGLSSDILDNPGAVGLNLRILKMIDDVASYQVAFVGSTSERSYGALTSQQRAALGENTFDRKMPFNKMKELVDHGFLEVAVNKSNLHLLRKLRQILRVLGDDFIVTKSSFKPSLLRSKKQQLEKLIAALDSEMHEIEKWLAENQEAEEDAADEILIEAKDMKSLDKKINSLQKKIAVIEKGMKKIKTDSMKKKKGKTLVLLKKELLQLKEVKKVKLAMEIQAIEETLASVTPISERVFNQFVLSKMGDAHKEEQEELLAQPNKKIMVQRKNSAHSIDDDHDEDKLRESYWQIINGLKAARSVARRKPSLAKAIAADIAKEMQDEPELVAIVESMVGNLSGEDAKQRSQTDSDKDFYSDDIGEDVDMLARLMAEGCRLDAYSKIRFFSGKPAKGDRAVAKAEEHSENREEVYSEDMRSSPSSVMSQ